jgi:heme A synthase
MLGLSTLLLALAVLLGGWMAIQALRRAAPPKLAAALLHGLLAVAGTALLLLALTGPERGRAAGAESFGLIAAIMLGLAAVPGCCCSRSICGGGGWVAGSSACTPRSPSPDS